MEAAPTNYSHTSPTGAGECGDTLQEGLLTAQQFSTATLNPAAEGNHTILQRPYLSPTVEVNLPDAVKQWFGEFGSTGGIYAWLDKQVAYVSTYVFMIFVPTMTIGTWALRDFRAGNVIQAYGNGGALVASYSLLAAFHVLRQVIRADNGALAKLALLASHCGDFEDQYSLQSAGTRSLRRWRKVLTGFGVAALILVPLTYMQMIIKGPANTEGICDRMNDDSDWVQRFECNAILYRLQLMFMVVYVVASIQICIAWFFSLLCGAALANTCVERLGANIHSLADTLSGDNSNVQTLVRTLSRKEAFNAEEWESKVLAPALILANETLPALSCWGLSIGMLIAGMWVCAAANIPWLISSDDIVSRMTNVLYVLSLAGAPLFFAIVPATVSTKCKQISRQLNTLQFYFAQNVEVQSLKNAILSSNGNQGVGFMTFGIMIDQRLLKKIVLSFVGFGGTALSFLIALGEGVSGTSNLNATCTIAEANQVRDLIQAATYDIQLDMTCAYNFTVQMHPGSTASIFLDS